MNDRRAAAPGEPRLAAAREEPPRSVERLADRRWLRLGIRAAILSAAVSVAVFWANLQPNTWTYLHRFDARVLPLLLGMVGAGWVASAWRARLLTGVLGHRLTLRQTLTVTLATEFAIAATPAGLGGLATRIELQRQLGISRTESACVLGADVSADLLFFALLWPLGIASVWSLLRQARLDDRLFALAPAALLWLGATLLVIGAGIILIRRGRKQARWRSAPTFLRRRRLRFTAIVRRFWRAGRRAFALTFVIAAVQWTCRYGLLPGVLLAFGQTSPLLPLMLLQGALFLLAAVIVLPGGGGSLEVLSALILPVLIPAELVGLVVIIWRLLTYHVQLLMGGLVLWTQLRSR